MNKNTQAEETEVTQAQPRPVFISFTRGAWMVLYADRSKGQRYTAGQFDASMFTKEQVEQWIAQQPNISLT